MQTVAALYGFIPPHEEPQAWGADACISEPLELMSWLADDMVCSPGT